MFVIVPVRRVVNDEPTADVMPVCINADTIHSAYADETGNAVLETLKGYINTALPFDALMAILQPERSLS